MGRLSRGHLVEDTSHDRNVWADHWEQAKGAGFGPLEALAPVDPTSESLHLSRLYARFSSAAERELLDTCPLPLAETLRMQGRGQGAHFELVNALSPSKVGSITTSKDMNLWMAAKARLEELWRVKLAMRWRQQGHQHHHWACAWLHQRRGQLAGAWVGDTAGKALFLAGLGDLGSVDPAGTKALAAVAQGQTEQAQLQLHKQGAQQFKAWLVAALGNGSKAAHAITKPRGPSHEPAEAGPLDEVAAKRHFWGSLWDPGLAQSPPGHPGWLQRLRALAQEASTEVCPITEAQMVAAIQRGPPAAALGADSWRPRDWAQLSPRVSWPFFRSCTASKATCVGLARPC